MKMSCKKAGVAIAATLTLSAPVFAQDGAPWSELTVDDAGSLSAAEAAQVGEIRNFRTAMAGALANCDRDKLLTMFAPDYVVQEGSGWTLDRDEMIATCGNAAWTTGIEDATPLTMSIRPIGSDGAVATGTSRLHRGGADTTVRWLAAYRKNASGQWEQAFGQVHRTAPVHPKEPDRTAILGGPPNRNAGPPPMPALTPDWVAQFAKDQPADTVQNSKLAQDVVEWVEKFSAQAETRSIDAIDPFYADNFTMSHGSGHVENRDTRMQRTAASGGAAELRPPLGSSVRSLGNGGAVYATISPFAFNDVAKGILRTAMVLERSDDPASEGWKLTALLVNSYWGPLVNQRAPSGCEAPSPGNPEIEFSDPQC